MQNDQNRSILYEEHLKIIRRYPDIKTLESHPYGRYNAYHFNKLNDEELKNQYNKWKKGINYNTNRKITIDGKLHKNIGEKFFFFGKCIFEVLIDINRDEYLKETKKINNLIDIKNEEIHEYNELVYNTIEKINLLEKWNDFVEFEGIKYGIDIIHNNIHRENDCFGVIKFDHYEECCCSTCNWRSCGSSGTEYVKCEKCNIIFRK